MLIEHPSAVLTGIARIFREVLTCQTKEDLYRACLAVAEEMTQSKFGFLGEINRETGKLDSIAMSDPGWDACQVQALSGQGKSLPVGLEIHGIYGRVLLDGKSLLTNDPSSHPDRIGTPPGHPPLTAFVGVPLVHAGVTIGMVGLGNREGGYGPEQLLAAEALAPAIVQAIINKRIEEALQQSERRFRALTEKGGEYITVVDAGGTITLEIPTERRTLGYAAGDLVGRNMFELVHPDDHEEARRLFAQVIRQPREPVELEARIGARDGSWRWLHTVGSNLLDDPAVGGIVLNSRDITERKHAEEALRNAAQQWQATFDAVGDAVFLLDAEQRIRRSNRAAQALFSKTEADLEDRFCHEVVHAAAAPIAGCPVLRLRNSLHREAMETAIGDRCFLVTVDPVLDAAGKLAGAVHIMSDVTERKRAENVLKTVNEGLEQRVAERTEAVQMLHDIASMANQAQNSQYAIEHCLQVLAAHNGWSFGQALLPAAEDGDVLVAACVCCRDNSERFSRFHEATRGVRFRRGQCLPGRVFAAGRPEWTTDLRRDLIECRALVAEDLGLGTAVAFPVLVGEKVAAVMEFFSDRVIPSDNRMIDAMVGVGMQLGRVLERAAFEEHLLTIAEEIQQGIAQDLHDDIGQELTGLGLKTETLAEMLAAKSPAGQLAADVAIAVSRMWSKVRGLSRALLPLELEAGLLAGALERLAITTTTGTRIACTLDCARRDRVFEGRVALHLYRISQEAVSNAVRHSGAQNICIILKQENGASILGIEDDGRGLPPDALQAGGMGLRTMHYRAGLIGGKLEIGPGPNGGTRVVCRCSGQLHK